jgi:hypothetical protein
MPLTTQQIIKAIRANGFPSFTARKLERWANRGVVPHPKRVGKGRGKGWTFLWPDEALPIAHFIEDVSSWQRDRRFEDTVLWAWLRGAPVSPSVVRRYLKVGLRRHRVWLEHGLKRARRNLEEEPLDLVDHLAEEIAYRHVTLRVSKLPADDRRQALQEALASLSGTRWTERSARQTTAIYKRTWEAVMRPFGIPWATKPAEVRAQQKFFAFRNLERLAREVSDKDLLAVQASFTQEFYFAGIVLEQRRLGRRVAKATLARAEATHKKIDALLQVDPAWVIALFLHNIVTRREAN